MSDVSIILNAIDNTRSAVQSVRSGLESVKASADTVAASIGAIGLAGVAISFAGTVKEAIDAADAINKLSQRTGVAAEALSQLQFAAKMSDVSAESLTTGIKKLNVSISEGLGGSQEKLQLFKNLGIDLRDASGAAKTADKILLEMANSFAGATDGANKTAYAVGLLGKAGDEMIPLLNGGGSAMEAMMKKADKLGLTIGSDFAARAEEFNDNLTILESSGKRLAISLADDLVSSLGKAMKAMADASVEGGKFKGVIAGIQMLFTGDDQHKNNVALVQQTELMLSLENRLAILRAQGYAEDHPRLVRTKEALANVNAELKTTMAYRKVLDDEQSASEAAKNPPPKKDLPTIKHGGAASTYETLRDAIAKEKELADLELANGEKISAAERMRVDDLSKIAAALKAGKISQREAAILNNEAIAASDARRAADQKANAASYLEGVREKISAQSLELASQDQLTEGEKMAAAWTTKLRDGKLDLLDTQKQSIASSLEELIALEKANALKKQQLKLGADLVAAGQKYVNTQDDEIKKANEQLDNIGLTKGQIDRLIASKLELEAVTDDELATNMRLAASYAGDLHDAYIQYATDLEQAAKKKRELAGIKMAIGEKETAFEDFKRLWDSVDRTAHDTFVNIFEGGQDAFTKLRNTLKSTLLDLLYQMTVRKWVFDITAVISGNGSIASTAQDKLLGGSNAGGALNTVSNVNGAASLYYTGSQYVFGSYAGATGASLAYANTVGALGGDSLGALISANGGWAGVSTGAAAGTAAGSAAGASAAGAGAGASGAAGAESAAASFGPYGWIAALVIAAIASVAEGNKVDWAGAGISGKLKSGGVDLQRRTDYVQDHHGVFGIGSYTTHNSEYTALDTSISSYLTKLTDTATNSVKGYAKTLGLSADAVDGFSKQIDLTLSGLTEAEQQNLISSTIASYVADMVDSAYGDVLAELSKTGESSADTLARLSQTIAVVNGDLAQLGISLLPVGLQSTKVAAGLVDAFGGMDKMQSTVASYFQAFYSDGERAAMAAESLDEAFAKLGVSVPSSKAEFRALVESIDVTTTAGQSLAASILQLAPAFDQAASAAAAAAESMLGAIQNYGTSSEARNFIVEQIRNGLAQGGINLTSEQISNATRADARALYLQYAASGNQAAMDAILKWQQKFADINPVTSGSSTTGGSSGSASAGQTAADSIATAWQQITDSLWGEVQRIRGLIEGTGDSAYAAAQARFATATAMARAGDQTAAQELPKLSQAMLSLAESNAKTLVDLRIAQGQTAASLSQTASMLSSQYGLSVPFLDGGTNYVPHDMLVVAHRGEAVVPADFNAALLYGSTPAPQDSGELAALREDVRAGQAQIAALMGELVRMNKKWDGDGLPETRTV